MFNNNETFDIDKIADYLKSNWNTVISDINGEDGTFSFSMQNETVALAAVPAQIPFEDIQATAKYAYNWTTAEKDLENHNSHSIVSVISNNSTELERFTILTKVLASIVATTNCIGVYDGLQSLLIPREQYLDSAEVLKSNQIPLDLWIYIGLRKGQNGNSAYSYGLTAFGKLEIEFINSKLDLEEIHSFLSNICTYVINSNITFKNGETLSYTEEEKFTIAKSKGQFVEKESFKISYNKTT
ncbi:DUF4261 domain-containing protein [Pedobacter sp. MW01-1-1]|uniref:DUF4261 domain-containing protein n=1 Tax=Pedobacter sp. MW01-1-1 TaxID=3383027 RepID=UPI003FF0162E